MNSTEKDTKVCRSCIPVKRILFYMAIASLLLAGITFSRYIEIGGGGDGASVVKNGNVSIRQETLNDHKVAPGVPVSMDPSVTYPVDAAPEYAAYVFVEIDTAGWDFSRAQGRFTLTREGTDKVLMSWDINSAEWKVLKSGARQDGGTETVLYRYMGPGKTFRDSYIVKDSRINVSADLLRTEIGQAVQKTGSVAFQARAVQAGGFDSADQAWTSVSSK